MADQSELLFDTNALIDIYRGRNAIKPYFDSILDETLLPYVSVITEAELWRGLRADETGRHELMMERFISLPIDSDAARLAGSWMQKYSSSGLGWMDALISATGKVAGLTVLTRDKRLTAVLSSELKFEGYSL
ncbi:MAG: VapC toxin family PIN domain ribonuclease [Anaerolineales bacterium]|nr:type II toxin-antitoxin system VapC family toxin [Anaerolineae bacterium]PWB71643.1 MAG: VapC toxin family PIN domain ribonuclease [Anaerolineales bacterium]